MAIVVTAPQTDGLPAAGDSTLSGSANQPFVSPNTLPLAPVSQPVSYTDSNRLNAYLLRHNQMARTAGRQGFVSFVPIVATPNASAREATEDEVVSEESRPEMEVLENK